MFALHRESHHISVVGWRQRMLVAFYTLLLPLTNVIQSTRVQNYQRCWTGPLHSYTTVVSCFHGPWIKSLFFFSEFYHENIHSCSECQSHCSLHESYITKATTISFSFCHHRWLSLVYYRMYLPFDAHKNHHS